MNDRLVHLGVLAARTAQGRRAVAVSLSGGVEMHHLVDAGFVSGSKMVEDWLLGAGINPEEAFGALPVEYVVESLILPALEGRTLVVPHCDLDVNVVDMLVSECGRVGTPAIVSGIDISGPLDGVVNGIAGRRADALRDRYEQALVRAATVPQTHVFDGMVEGSRLSRIEIDGPFAKGAWTLDGDDDALFVMLSLTGIAGMARFEVKDGPAAAALARLAREVGLESRPAA
jgi:hypothetical protein